ncbi:MAG: hypothetical protein IT370_31765 [Deltaproteobacteria bacterium]|nr:hypothetical protein [Deltaproteobacteria bacterium]
MLPSGLLVTLELALGPEAEPAVLTALTLGMFREDVVMLPGLALQSPSFGHLYPRSRARCSRLFARAVATARTRGTLAGAFDLGRAVHVLTDMACPAHALAVPHYLHDPFERWVERHVAELAELPVPALPAGVAVAAAATGAPAVLVDSLAAAARRHAVDRTQLPFTPARRRGDLRVGPADRARQARELIPLAAAHVRALLAAHAGQQAR